MRNSSLLLGAISILAAFLPAHGAGADSSLTTLVVFNGTNGKRLDPGLLLGADGNIYGTTFAGGANDIGTIFKMTPDGKLVTLASFDGRNGKSPGGDLVQGKDDNVYGTTIEGGLNDAGVIFKITPGGTLTIVYSFSESFENVDSLRTQFVPYQLFNGSDGCFYGTTTAMGIWNGPEYVFRMTSNSVLTTIAKPVPASDPAWLVKARDGNTYVTTRGNGFRLEPLFAFERIGTFGRLDRLVEGKDGTLYGTTFQGGPQDGGTIFRMNPDGTVTNLVAFDANNSVSGRSPNELTLGKDGNFYGTTFAGDTNGPRYSGTLLKRRDANGAYVTIHTETDRGTVFRMSPSGTITTLAVFYKTNGCNPLGRLVEGNDGSFYGTTSGGGSGVNPSGTIFRLTVSPPSLPSTR